MTNNGYSHCNSSRRWLNFHTRLHSLCLNRLGIRGLKGLFSQESKSLKIFFSQLKAPEGRRATSKRLKTLGDDFLVDVIKSSSLNSYLLLRYRRCIIIIGQSFHTLARGQTGQR